jgi:hypothetical protein
MIRAAAAIPFQQAGIREVLNRSLFRNFGVSSLARTNPFSQEASGSQAQLYRKR